MIVALAGCGGIGPGMLQNGRVNYNKVIQQTSKEQIFMNIVRVQNDEPMLFMDVTEVDAAFLVQGSVSGGQTGIGARAGSSGGTLAGTVGAAGGALEFQETPTIRYQPLQGQPLVEQISTPITVDTIGRLFDSQWPIGPVLGLVADRLTPNYSDLAIALDAINILDDYGAMILLPAKSQSAASEAKGSSASQTGANIAINTVTVQTSQGAGNATDTHDIYLRKAHPLPFNGQKPGQATDEIDAAWQRLHSLYDVSRASSGGQDDLIEIPTVATISTVPQRKEKKPITIHQPPSFRTRSALGLLKGAIGAGHIKVVPLADYQAIVNAPWNSPKTQTDCPSANWYTDDPKNLNPDQIGADAKNKFAQRFRENTISDHRALRCLYTMYDGNMPDRTGND
jgi:hypothetical protein